VTDLQRRGEQYAQTAWAEHGSRERGLEGLRRALALIEEERALTLAAIAHLEPQAPPAKDKPLMTAGDILGTAREIVAGDRHRTHGDKVQNHENIAALWNAYWAIMRGRAERDPLAPFRALDVALMMALLKVARTQLGQHNADNYVDLAGYAGVAGEVARDGLDRNWGR
jgi:hypothetical protein